jgi:hypothetical protein
VDKAQQVIQLTMKAANKTANKLGIPVQDAISPTLETDIERLESIKDQTSKPPEIMNDVITYVKRYQEAQMKEKNP